MSDLKDVNIMAEFGLCVKKFHDMKYIDGSAKAN